jgi:hypothetical protein
MMTDHHTIITVDHLETMIAMTMMIMMTISIIHLVLVFVELLLPMLGHYFHPII